MPLGGQSQKVLGKHNALLGRGAVVMGDRVSGQGWPGIEGPWDKLRAQSTFVLTQVSILLSSV